MTSLYKYLKSIEIQLKYIYRTRWKLLRDLTNKLFVILQQNSFKLKILITYFKMKATMTYFMIKCMINYQFCRTVRAERGKPERSHATLDCLITKENVNQILITYYATYATSFSCDFCIRRRNVKQHYEKNTIHLLHPPSTSSCCGQTTQFVHF